MTAKYMYMYGLNPKFVSGLRIRISLPQKFNGDFLMSGYICDKIFMKLRSLSPEI